MKAKNEAIEVIGRHNILKYGEIVQRAYRRARQFYAGGPPPYPRTIANNCYQLMRNLCMSEFPAHFQENGQHFHLQYESVIVRFKKTDEDFRISQSTEQLQFLGNGFQNVSGVEMDALVLTYQADSGTEEVTDVSLVAYSGNAVLWSHPVSLAPTVVEFAPRSEALSVKTRVKAKVEGTKVERVRGKKKGA